MAKREKADNAKTAEALAQQADKALAEKGVKDEAENSTGDKVQPDTETATTSTAENDAVKANSGNKSSDEPEVKTVQPVVFVVRLKNTHPLASYGRCGYRFHKDKDVEIPVGDLSAEQVVTLSQDPYLDFSPVCEE